MTDNNDGTYSFSYSVLLDGTVTVVVQLLTGGGVYSEWFDSTDWSGTPARTATYASLNINGGSTYNFVNGRGTAFTANFYTKLKPPTTESYKFYLLNDDGARFQLNSVTMVDHRNSPCI